MDDENRHDAVDRDVAEVAAPGHSLIVRTASGASSIASSTWMCPFGVDVHLRRVLRELHARDRYTLQS
jgi:hypothetical protein